MTPPTAPAEQRACWRTRTDDTTCGVSVPGAGNVPEGGSFLRPLLLMFSRARPLASQLPASVPTLPPSHNPTPTTHAPPRRRLLPGRYRPAPRLAPQGAPVPASPRGDVGCAPHHHYHPAPVRHISQRAAPVQRGGRVVGRRGRRAERERALLRAKTRERGGWPGGRHHAAPRGERKEHAVSVNKKSRK